MRPETKMVASLLPLVVVLGLSGAAYSRDDHRHGRDRDKDDRCFRAMSWTHTGRSRCRTAG